jgi:hypothetical protein
LPQRFLPIPINIGIKIKKEKVLPACSMQAGGNTDVPVAQLFKSNE